MFDGRVDALVDEGFIERQRARFVEHTHVDIRKRQVSKRTVNSTPKGSSRTLDVIRMGPEFHQFRWMEQPPWIGIAGGDILGVGWKVIPERLKVKTDCTLA